MNLLLALAESSVLALSGILVMVATSNDPIQQAQLADTISSVSTWSLCPTNTDIEAVELVTGRWSVGSGTENRVTLSDESVSPLHCLLIANERQLILRAWNEPTLVNGKSVREAILSSGDELTIGQLQFRIEHSPAVESDEIGFSGVQGFGNTAFDEAQVQGDFNATHDDTRPTENVENRGAEILSRIDMIDDTLDLLDDELHGRDSQNSELDALIDRLEQNLSQRRELSSSTRDVLDELRSQVANLESRSTIANAVPVNPITHDDPRLRSEQQRLDTVLESAGVHSEVTEANPNIDDERFERMERELQIRIEAKLSVLDDMTRLMHARADVIEKLSSEVEQAKDELKSERIVYENDLAVLHNERQALQAERSELDSQLASSLRETDIFETESNDNVDARPGEENGQTVQPLDEVNEFNCGREDWAAGDIDLLSQRDGFTFSESVQDEIARKLVTSERPTEDNQDESETEFDLGPEYQTTAGSEWTIEEDVPVSNEISANKAAIGELDLAKAADFGSEWDIVTNSASTETDRNEAQDNSDEIENYDVDDESDVDLQETTTVENEWAVETDEDEQTTTTEEGTVASEPLTEDENAVVSEYAVDNEFAIETESTTAETNAEISAETNNKTVKPTDIETPTNESEQVSTANDTSLDFDALLAGGSNAADEPQAQAECTIDLVEPTNDAAAAQTAEQLVNEEQLANDEQLAQQRQRLREYMEEFGTQSNEGNSDAEGDCDAQVPVGVAHANEFADGEITNGLRSRDEALRQLDDLVREATTRSDQDDPTLDSVEVDETSVGGTIDIASTDTIDIALETANETPDADETPNNQDNEREESNRSSTDDELDIQDVASTEETVQPENTQERPVQTEQAIDEWAVEPTSPNSEFDIEDDASAISDLNTEISTEPAETQVQKIQQSDSQVDTTDTEASAVEEWDNDPLASAFAKARAQDNEAETETEAPGLSLSIDDLFENKTTVESTDDESTEPTELPQSPLANSLINEFEASDSTEATAPDVIDPEGSQELRSRLAQMFEIPDLDSTASESNTSWDKNLGASETPANQTEEPSGSDSQTLELPPQASATSEAPTTTASIDPSSAEKAEESEAAAPAKSEDSQWDASDPDSVGAYMQQLLARNRRQSGVEEKPEEPAAPEPVSRRPDFPTAVQNLDEPVDKEENEDTEKRWLSDGPRHKQDRVAVRADMQALREVANTSARSAVMTASRKQLKVQIATKTAASLMALGFGATGLILKVSTLISSCVVGLGFIFAADLAWTIKRQLVAEKHGSTTTDEEVASETEE